MFPPGDKCLTLSRRHEFSAKQTTNQTSILYENSAAFVFYSTHEQEFFVA